ncbi:hypothetical protein [Flavobacterium sasangense]|uniref:hypothetical protein n=1 Tax=Flavobacterium sasangense TaxID=503361 RepID=UPI00047BE422|nr:hypothetical protein [Flavobacterium sasangense]
MNENEFGGWNGVKRTCLNHEDIEIFLELHDESIFIVQIDSAERNEKGYDVIDPIKSNNHNYCELVIDNVSLKINEWLGGKFDSRTAFAVCVEEIEAWLLTRFFDNTSKFTNPKQKFEYEFNKKLSKSEVKSMSEKSVFKKYHSLSKPFSKKKDLPKYARNNLSFNKFYEQLIFFDN